MSHSWTTSNCKPHLCSTCAGYGHVKKPQGTSVTDSDYERCHSCLGKGIIRD